MQAIQASRLSNSLGSTGLRVRSYKLSHLVARICENREAEEGSGEISEEEILRTVRTYRKDRRAPEITVAGEAC